MEEEYLELDKEYLETFNTGYTLSEIGIKEETLDRLNPQELEKMNINQSQLAVIKQGMKQHSKDVEQGYAKGKETNIKIEKGKSKTQSKDKELQKDLKKQREREQHQKKKGKNKGYNGYSH